jgi:hypothetical protein
MVNSYIILRSLGLLIIGNRMAKPFPARANPVQPGPAAPLSNISSVESSSYKVFVAPRFTNKSVTSK